MSSPIEQSTSSSPPTREQERPASQAGRPPVVENRWWTLVAVCLGTFMLLLDVTIVNVALPDIQTSLHASFTDLQWVVDAYALTLAALLLTSGSLADLYGRKLLYAIGLAVFTVASMLCGIAPGHLFLEISRGAQGVGGAIMFSVSLALLASTFHGKDRGVALGIWGAVTGSRLRLVRCWAVRSRLGCRGGGSSSSTCPSGWSPWQSRSAG